MTEIAIALALAFGLVALGSRQVKRGVPGVPAGDTVTGRSDPFTFAARQTGVDADLLRAVADVESSMRPAAVRHESGGRRSIGLMQVLCPSPLNNITGWCGTEPCNGGCDALFDEAINVTMGARILRWNLDNFGYPRGVAVYNGWAAHADPLNGPFFNQVYIDKVHRRLSDAAIARFAARWGEGTNAARGPA